MLSSINKDFIILYYYYYTLHGHVCRMSVVFIELKCKWLQTGLRLVDLENTKHLYSFLRVDILCIFENITFFEIFENYK